MDLSIFQAMGPVMIGPSSSHTAGAARLSCIARKTLSAKINHVSFGLHGSFAETYKGHGTDKALVAGALGFAENDPRLKDSFEIAKEQGMGFDFEKIKLDGVHENTVRMIFTLDDGTTSKIYGSSIGGGEIIIWNINGVAAEITGHSNILMVKQRDVKGVIRDVSNILAEHDINIATMKVERNSKGDTATTMVETDEEIPSDAVEALKKCANIISAQAINISE